jgi:hypothetical protein
VRTLVVDGSHGVGEAEFSKLELWDMDPATWIRTQAKNLLLLHPPRQAPPPKQALGENSSGNCACSFFKQNRAQYILSLSWDGFFTVRRKQPPAEPSPSSLVRVNRVDAVLFGVFTVLFFFFPQSERVITVIPCLSELDLRKSCRRGITISSTSLKTRLVILRVI